MTVTLAQSAGVPQARWQPQTGQGRSLLACLADHGHHYSLLRTPAPVDAPPVRFALMCVWVPEMVRVQLGADHRLAAAAARWACRWKRLGACYGCAAGAAKELRCSALRLTRGAGM